MLNILIYIANLAHLSVIALALKINWCLQILYLEALVHSQNCFMNFCTNLSLERKENVENINADI